MSASIVETIGPKGFGNYRVDWSGGSPKFEEVARAAEAVLVPGFVDIHFHGAFGIDLMSSSSQEILQMCRMLEREGYEAFLATTVTSGPEEIQHFLRKLPESEMIVGVHLEGPFISPAYPGAQPQGSIVDPPHEPSPWDDILADPRLRLVTLAPERPNALELILRLQKRGIVVSMGHSDATFEESRRGFEFGAQNTTHTFNAMRGFHHREAGLVGYALVTDGLRCELIYDRIHVCKEAARLLMRCKKLDDLLGVSDSTMATGMPEGTEITMWGLDCVIGEGTVRLKDSGGLAGSAVSLRNVFLNLWEDFGLEAAIRACCLNPRRVLGLKGGERVWLEFSPEGILLERHVLDENRTNDDSQK